MTVGQVHLIPTGVFPETVVALLFVLFLVILYPRQVSVHGF